MKIYSIIISIIFFLFFSNMSYSQSDFEKLSWIIDKWVSTDGESTSYEKWEKVNDSLYSGSSETVKDGETVFQEKLKLAREGSDIFYIADVKHNPAPVKFRLTAVSDNEAVFENPEHDFPRKIVYKQAGGNLHASIEGPGKDGKWRKVDFIMNKMR